MGRDVAELVEPYLSDDPTKWGKLASDIQWRRLQLLLLREVLVELRKLNSAGWQHKDTKGTKKGNGRGRNDRLKNAKGAKR